MIESAAELEGEDGFQGAMLWPRWSFPLPPKSHEPEKRATRLAQAVLRDAWVAEADLRPITQITEPGVVHEFIAEMPGLAETCSEHPSYLGAYAPQLLLPGFGGDFELLFDDWLAYARERGRDSDTVALHAPEFAGEDPATVVCTFVQGEINGPPVLYYEPADYLFWLLSEQSGWLPATVRETFLAGFRDWPAWLPWRRGGDDAFVQQLSRSRGGPVPKLEPEALAALETRASEAVVDLDLPEQGDDLAERLLASGVVEGYVRINRGRRS